MTIKIEKLNEVSHELSQGLPENLKDRYLSVLDELKKVVTESDITQSDSMLPLCYHANQSVKVLRQLHMNEALGR